MTNEHPRRYRKAEPKLDPMMRLLKAFHSSGMPDALDPEQLQKQRRSQEVLGNLCAPMTGMEWELFEIGTIPAAWMRLERPHRKKRAILYCHGGGYTSGNLGYSKVLASKLTRQTGFDVLAFEYRLAPEFPYPAALEDAEAVWNHLMLLGYGARDIVVAGDSAGGNLALSLCLKLRSDSRMLPGALLLMSPWTDLRCGGPSYEEKKDLDPMLTGDYLRSVGSAYAGGLDPADPMLSPVLADFSGFPPTLIQVGTHEILLSDSQALCSRMKEAGVSCRLEVWEDMWHVFQMFPLKKSARAMECMAHFLLEEL